MLSLDEKIPGCTHFTWREALWLPQWNRAANEADGLNDDVKKNLIQTFQWMEKVRDLFGKPLKVHVAYRPDAYNQLVKGAPSSMHKVGKAVDFDVLGLSCDDAKERLKGKLEDWDLRMEDNGAGAPWVHLDDRQPGPAGRFFKP